MIGKILILIILGIALAILWLFIKSAFRPGPHLKPSLPDDDDESQWWLCNCGHFITDGLHCPKCGAEPSWGCPCSQCQNPDPDDGEVEGWEQAMWEEDLP